MNDIEEKSVSIRQIARGELEILEQHLTSTYPKKHRERFAMQQNGEALYLIAWFGKVPIGHVFIRWKGSVDEPMASILENCPNIEDLFVTATYRSKGIGDLLMGEVELLCAKRGYSQVGLGVGIENATARSFYENRGYRDAGCGEHRTTYPYINKQGQKQTGEEVCVYLTKKLH
jgi:GNAT superfamily N-acetyltransferase